MSQAPVDAAESSGQTPSSKAEAPAMCAALPDYAEVASVVEALLGKSVECEKLDDGALNLDSSPPAAVFVDEATQIGAVIASDLAFAAFSGAALTMIPDDMAKEAIKGKKLTDDLAENYHEIMNILSSVFNLDAGAHLRLLATHVPPEEYPRGVRDFIAGPTQRVSAKLRMQDYGDGVLTILVPTDKPAPAAVDEPASTDSPADQAQSPSQASSEGSSEGGEVSPEEGISGFDISLINGRKDRVRIVVSSEEVQDWRGLSFRIQKLCGQPRTNFTIEFTKGSHLTSSDLGCLVIVNGMIRNRSGSLDVFVPRNSRMAQLFEYSLLDRILHLSER